ncbi:hypothetical protein [Lactiplantibacillus argentoratensis]|uniref:hypothetical protein n=1 Tax=Lactiplantibacillus argentoratensis TaxID=271881 RepID=UPI003D7CBB6D
MNTRILNALKQTTLIEEKQKASHCFVEDMPPYAINQELSLKEHGRVLSGYTPTKVDKQIIKACLLRKEYFLWAEKVQGTVWKRNSFILDW